MEQTQWLGIYRRAKLPPETGDAVRDLMDVAHGGVRYAWAGGMPDSSLATELRSRWELLRQAATVPSIAGQTIFPRLGELDPEQGQFAGELLKLLSNSLDVSPAVREYWRTVITGAVKALAREPEEPDAVSNVEGGAS